MNFPADLLYTEHDEWIRKDGDVVTVGITDYAQDALGELVFVQVPDVGATYAAGDAVAEVESTKATAEIYTPVAGEIVEVNDALDGGESLVNEDPYGKGWIYKLRVSDASGLDGLMDVATYQKKIAG